MSVIKWWLTNYSKVASEPTPEYIPPSPPPTDAVPFYQINKL